MMLINLVQRNYAGHIHHLTLAINVEKDKKNPRRWVEAYLCRSTVSKHDQTPYKRYVLDKCRERNDEWASEVERVLGALSDLHAVEARYHKDCMSRFFSDRNCIGKAPGELSELQNEVLHDSALQQIIDLLCEDRTKLWNSVELFQIYKEKSGIDLNRSQLITKLSEHFDHELLILSSPGYAKIIVFQNQAVSTLNMVKDESDSDIENSIKLVARQISRECKDIHLDETKYEVDINAQIVNDSISCTLQKLLATVSRSLDDSLPAMMIGSIVTSAVKNKPTDLQVSLGVLLRDSKTLLGYTYDYGITCSYDEVLRFKKSAAVAAVKDPKLQGISSSGDGLIQTVIDNFDAHIYSPNGKLATHSLAMILTQPSSAAEVCEQKRTIPRLKHDKIRVPIPDDNDDDIMVHVCANKNPPMPHVPHREPGQELVLYQDVSTRRAGDLDFQFLQDICITVDCPEYNGYNTKLCREQGHTLKPQTNIVYLPLIDRPPADPATIMGAMVKAKKLTEDLGQKYTILTADQQLYRVAVHVLWENQGKFTNFYLRLGGMHLLMSYVGCIGTLMADSGIVEVLSVAFGGVLKMLSGKKYPDNVRALRMLVEEILRPVIAKHQITSMTELQHILHDVSLQSRTAKLWVECLIDPVFIIMKYVRAEREADWPLHLATVKEMLPLFFAAGHMNYTRYGLYYLRSMEEMPSNVKEQFLKGQHTMHHKAGLFNGIWSDMVIETTYMRFGHGQSGIIGLTLKPETLKTWAYSLHTCNNVTEGLNALREHEQSSTSSQHKEEMKARIGSDGKDRQLVREKLELCIDPIYSEQYPNGLVNIVTGKVVAHPAVNVENAVAIGQSQMDTFEKGWPASFYEPIHNTVNTMAFARKHIKVVESKVFDTELIYARAMGLQGSVRDFDSKNLMSHELSPPSSLNV